MPNHTYDVSVNLPMIPRTQLTRGQVRWPKPHPRRFHDTGEGGMWAYAFWPARHDLPPRDDGLRLLLDPEHTAVSAWPDPLSACHGVENVLALPLPDVILDDTGRVYTSPDEVGSPGYVGPDGDPREREAYLRYVENAGTPLIGAVFLGSTNISLADPDGSYFTVADRDLTRAATRTLRRLDHLYDRRHHIVTYLDT